MTLRKIKLRWTEGPEEHPTKFESYAETKPSESLRYAIDELIITYGNFEADDNYASFKKDNLEVFLESEPIDDPPTNSISTTIVYFNNERVYKEIHTPCWELNMVTIRDYKPGEWEEFLKKTYEELEKQREAS